MSSVVGLGYWVERVQGFQSLLPVFSAVPGRFQEGFLKRQSQL